jgi:ring-1,2-phenylacetyl-CoA epoxidase subunit PaaE
MSAFYSLTVSDIRRLTPESVAIDFEVPESLKDTFAYKAGQYITLRMQQGGEELRRAYSLSSAPGSGKWTIGVKKVPEGQFSVYANEKLKAGDALEVMPPEGRFVYSPGSGIKRIAAFAAGSGITPVMGILSEALGQDPDCEAVLVYGNRSAEQAMFLGELEALKEKYPDRFFMYCMYSREREGDSLFGHIENSTVNYILNNKHKEWTFDRFYLCGPEPMIRAVESSLLEKGVAQEDVLHELFTTDTQEDDSLAEELEGKTKVSVVLDDQSYELVMDRKELVLDAVLKAKIDAPYSCQGGVCSTCIARVTEGSAEMVKNQILTDSEISEGFILTCQAHPTSATLKVDYDDV